MKALAIFAMAFSLMASSVSSHAEVITFSENSNSYTSFRVGYGNDSDWFAALGNLSSPPNVSNGAVTSSLHLDQRTLQENSAFSIASTNNSLLINSVTFNVTSNVESTIFLYPFRKVLPNEALESYQIHYGFASTSGIIVMPPLTTNLSVQVALPTGTSAVIFRIYEGTDLDVYSTLRITSMDVTRVSPVSEPNASLMMMSGIGIMGFAARRRKKKLHA